AVDRHAARARDEAALVRFAMELERARDVAGGRDLHAWAQRDALDASTTGMRDEAPVRIVDVARDADAGARARGEVREHVARRDRRDEQLLGIVERGVAAKLCVGAAEQHRLAVDLDPELALVRRVAGGPDRRVTVPAQGESVVVAHASTLR